MYEINSFYCYVAACTMTGDCNNNNTQGSHQSSTIFLHPLRHPLHCPPNGLLPHLPISSMNLPMVQKDCKTSSFFSHSNYVVHLSLGNFKVRHMSGMSGCRTCTFSFFFTPRYLILHTPGNYIKNYFWG